MFDLSAESRRWPIDTPGGRFYAEWDSQAPDSREGQPMFFFQFLEAGERWKTFLAGLPAALHRQPRQRPL
jgi:hypothetical protein